MGSARVAGAATAGGLACATVACSAVFGIHELEPGDDDALAPDASVEDGSAAPDGSSILRASDASDADASPADVVLDTDATGGDASSPPTPSCAAGGVDVTACGPDGGAHESCCASLPVPAGSFLRSYDGVANTSKAFPATVSAFRLDKYEVTVDRFRQFVAAVTAGWRPAAGSGKHVHLNGGAGLTTTGGGYETGWDSSWNASLPATSEAWTAALSCNATYPTWTAQGKGPANGNLPINCVGWYEAYAFCIWDGAFLPSEAEWNFAAAGGGGPSGQRVFPWSSPPTSTTLDCTYANGASGCTVAPNGVGSESPKGNGAFGQADLSGNLWEWVLDAYANYVVPCTDCSAVAPPTAHTAASARVIRGGDFYDGASYLTASARSDFPPEPGAYGVHVGVRCARVP